MGNYAKTLSRQIQRALRLAEGDLEALFANAADLGMSDEALASRLVTDLETNGPIFGRFFENLMGATEQSILSAQRQGIFIGEALADGQEAVAARLGDLSDDDWTELVGGNNPDAMEAFERGVLDDQEYTWVAALVKTCRFCLPLHGKTMKKSEWAESGWDPETIHLINGFNSPCYCRFVLSDTAKDDESAGPEVLRRDVIETKSGLRGNKRTARAVAQKNAEKADEAAEKANQTLSGRRTMRELGKINA